MAESIGEPVPAEDTPQDLRTELFVETLHLKESDKPFETRGQQCTARDFSVTRREITCQERENQFQNNAQYNCEEGFRLHRTEAEIKMMKAQLEQARNMLRQSQELYQFLGKQAAVFRQE